MDARLFCDTVGRNKKQIENYISNQLEKDQMSEQMNLKKFVDSLRECKMKCVSYR